MKPELSSRLKELTRQTGTEDLLQVDYPRPRFQISLKHALIAASIVAIGTVGWLVIQDEPQSPSIAELAQSTTSPQSLSGQQDSTAPESSVGAASVPIVVSVVGHVAEPGLVTLPANARVADALALARALPDADLTAVNLAQVLTDGVQIHVVAVGEAIPGGSAQPVGGAGVSSGGSGPAQPVGGAGVSLNAATLTELITLPGVGEKTAQAIIDHRESVGGFSSVEQLLDVKGIGQAKFEQIFPGVNL